jgi:hypothetical protein
VTTEKGHGREEERTYLQFPAPKTLPGFTAWKGLKSIGIVTSCCLRDGKETIEIRYYISSLVVNVIQFARAVRGHWGIENTCHWSLDMTFREDESRLRDRHLRENFAWLNRFVLSFGTERVRGTHPERLRGAHLVLEDGRSGQERQLGFHSAFRLFLLFIDSRKR